MILGIDFETCSAVDIKRVGAWQYSCHPSTRVHCGVFIFAPNIGAKDLEERIAHRWRPDSGEPIPFSVRRHIEQGFPVLAHNASFEKSIISNTLRDFPQPPMRAWHDTAALAAAANLPWSLEGLANTFRGATKKDTDGGDLMKSKSKVEIADDGSFIYPTFTPDEWERLLSYCHDDVLAMLDCWFRVPQLTAAERLVWLADQKINLRGVRLDQERASIMARMAAARSKTLNADIFAETGSMVPKTSSVNDLRDWLTDAGVTLPKLPRKQKDGSFKATPTANAETLKRLVNGDANAEIKRVLALRLEAGKLTSLAKLKRIPELVSNDGRLRYALRYCEAHTGRWASHGLQLHNLPRDRLGGIRDVVESLVADDDLEVLEMLVDEPLAVLSQLLRSVIVAAPGYELLAGDFSAIEARVLAWLAGQQDVLDIFASGQDVYVADAKSIGSDDRQLGKVARLGLGYGMGAKKFAVTALSYGVALSLKEARRVQLAWRANNPMIVGFWHALEQAFRDAIVTEGQVFTAGRVEVVRYGACLHAKLPSGRSVRYWRPRTRHVLKRIETVNEEGEIVISEFETEEVQFFVPDARTMLVESTYGGKLCENLTQAVSRDLLGEALLRLEDNGYPAVMHVHDAIASEVLAGTRDVAEFCQLMATAPAWAHGLPIAVDGYRDTRFRK